MLHASSALQIADEFIIDKQNQNGTAFLTESDQSALNAKLSESNQRGAALLSRLSDDAILDDSSQSTDSDSNLDSNFDDSPLRGHNTHPDADAIIDSSTTSGGAAEQNGNVKPKVQVQEAKESARMITAVQSYLPTTFNFMR